MFFLSGAIWGHPGSLGSPGAPTECRFTSCFTLGSLGSPGVSPGVCFWGAECMHFYVCRRSCATPGPQNLCIFTGAGAPGRPPGDRIYAFLRVPALLGDPWDDLGISEYMHIYNDRAHFSLSWMTLETQNMCIFTLIALTFACPG